MSTTSLPAMAQIEEGCRSLGTEMKNRVKVDLQSIICSAKDYQVELAITMELIQLDDLLLN